jgi:predicted glutamine amidotransferase
LTGDALFAHSDERHWDEGGGRFSALRPPGLSMTTGQELLARGLKVEVPHRDARVLYVASVPLTNKGWTPIAEGTVLAFRRGTEMAGMAA